MIQSKSCVAEVICGSLLFDFFRNLVGELFEFALLEFDTLAFEIFHDILAGILTFFGSEKETNCCAGDCTADNCENDV